MQTEQAFIDAINREAGQGDRSAELIYADWLYEQGDPRGEAWMRLVGEGKRPWCPGTRWLWIKAHIPERNVTFSPEYAMLHETFMPPSDFGRTHYTFYAAMNAAAVAWVRCHRDPDFLLTERSLI